MDTMVELNQFADDHQIGVYYQHIPACKCISFPDNVILDTDYIYHPQEEEVACAFGIGSCYYEAFYDKDASEVTKRQAHHKTKRFAFEMVVPREAVEDAVAHGCRESWEIAEYLGKDPKIVDEAVFYYRNGYMKSSA